MPPRLGDKTVVRQALRHLLDAGITDELAPGLCKRLRLTNRLSLTIFLVTFPYIGIFWFSGHKELGLLVIPTALSYIAVPLLNMARAFRASRLTMIGVANTAPLAFALLVGRDSWIHLYLFATMCLPVVLFEPSERRLLVLSSILPAALIIAMTATNFFGVTPLAFNPAALLPIRLAIVVSTASTIIAALIYLVLANEQAERLLARSVTEIKEEAKVRVASESALRIEKEKLSSIFATIQDIVVLMDRECRYVAINDRIRSYGLDPNDLIGKTIAALLPPSEAAAMEARHQQVLQSGVPASFDYCVKDLQGKTVWFNTSLTPVRDPNGNVTGLVAVSRNRTDEHYLREGLSEARDAARAASIAKTHFLANVSHEIRTPITVIMGFAELLADPSVHFERRASTVEVIMRNARHLNSLVGDILDVSVIESGNLRLEFTIVSLAAELELSIEEPRRVALAKGLDFRVEWDASVPNRMYADPVRFRQVLMNIVGNAVKFTSAGSVVVQIKLNKAMSPPVLEVRVADTGAGVDPADVDRIFEPFVQGDATTSRRFGGTGLGLALSRKLAAAMGGGITLEKSSPGQGSTFLVSVAFPLVTEDIALGIGEPAPTIQLTGVRVLIVDDTPDLRTLLSDVLTLHGATVDQAIDGPSGLAKGSDGTYDLIFMDIQMPGIDGHEVTRRIRRAGLRVPIVALTGRALAGERAACLEAGCNDYLPKPVALATLLQTTQKWARRPSPNT